MQHLGKQRRIAAHWRTLAALALLCALVAALPRLSVAPVVWAQEAIVAPPVAPGLAAPVDGAMLDEPWAGVELQWQAVPGAVDYQVILNGGERTGPWVAETSWSPGSLPAGAYQWAVQARNAAGISALGPEFTFTVMPAGGYEASEVAAPETLEPLPLQLQQQAQQGKDGVAVESDGSAGSAPAPAPASSDTTDTAAAPATAGTPVPTPVAEAPPPAAAEPAAEEGIVTDGANVVDSSGAAEDGGKNKDKDKKEKKSDDAAEDEKPEREKRDREPREDRPNHRSNGNGGVAEIIAVPPTWTPASYAMPEAIRQMPLELHQQDASDAVSSGAGESGTINGQPRETTDNAPAEIVGPGAPGEVILPPSVPGVPAPGNLDPAVAPGIGGTTELTFDAISDTTVFTSSPGSPQSPESINSLAIGGPQGAVALMSFDVEGVGDGTVLGARLTFYGAGAAGAPGGSVGIIYDYVVPDGLTANGVPDGGSALNVHGAPSWFERVEPDGLTAVDVTSSVSGDGKITFVLPGQGEAAGAVYSLESGAPPQLILTVALPA